MTKWKVRDIWSKSNNQDCIKVDRLHALPTQKYGEAKVSTVFRTNIENLKRKLTNLNNGLTHYWHLKYVGGQKHADFMCI